MIARLDDAQLWALPEQAQSALIRGSQPLESDSRFRSSKPSRSFRVSSAVNQSKLDAQGKVSQAGQLAAVEAALAQAKASSDQANWDADRLTAADRGDISEREGKQAITAAETQKAASTPHRGVDAARCAGCGAANLDNPAIRTLRPLWSSSRFARPWLM